MKKCLQADGTQAGHVILGRGAWVDVEPDAVVAQRENNIAHNITLRHAPVAERMLGYSKNQIFNAIRGTDKKWREVIDGVVKDYT